MEAGQHLSHRDKMYHSRGSVGCLWQIIPRVCHEDMERRRILARDASGEAAGKLREAEDPRSGAAGRLPAHRTRVPVLPHQTHLSAISFSLMARAYCSRFGFSTRRVLTDNPRCPESLLSGVLLFIPSRKRRTGLPRPLQQIDQAGSCFGPASQRHRLRVPAPLGHRGCPLCAMPPEPS